MIVRLVKMQFRPEEVETFKQVFEDSKDKITLLIRPEGAWNNDISSGRKPETDCNFPQIYESFRSSHTPVVPEVISIQRSGSSFRIPHIIQSKT